MVSIMTPTRGRKPEKIFDDIVNANQQPSTALLRELAQSAVTRHAPDWVCWLAWHAADLAHQIERTSAPDTDQHGYCLVHSTGYTGQCPSCTPAQGPIRTVHKTRSQDDGQEQRVIRVPVEPLGHILCCHGSCTAVATCRVQSGDWAAMACGKHIAKVEAVAAEPKPAAGGLPEDCQPDRIRCAVRDTAGNRCERPSGHHVYEVLTASGHRFVQDDGRCPAAHRDNHQPCEGPVDAVEIQDRRGGRVTGCLLHGAQMYASLTGARVIPGTSDTAPAEVFNRAEQIRRQR
jgi:hypothetical protein